MKLCECGCGKPTNRIRFRCPKTGLPAGSFSRFVKGHHNRILEYHFKTGEFTRNGYVYVYAPDHPYPTQGKYVNRGRLVLERKMGRYLSMDEEVHHINCIRDDDREENLMAVTRGQHNREHHKPKLMIEKRWREDNAIQGS